MNLASEFERVFEIMSSSFPEIEYRTKEGQRELLQHPEYRLITEVDETGRLIAFLAVWEFQYFRFIEHLAVDRSVRGSGVGKRIMQKCMKESDKPIILEVELPDDELTRRRIQFYERLGFHLNEYSYEQPPLRAAQRKLPLNIMSHPRLLTEEEFLACKALLYSKVYRVTDA